jgi:hypothetical protein
MGKDNNLEHYNEIMNKEIADSVPVATVNEVKSRTGVNNQTAYVIADDFTENPSELLGRVIEVRKSTTGECPSSLSIGKDVNFEFSASSVYGFNIDLKTSEAKPMLRSSIIVDDALCGEVGFLNFLSGQLKKNETYSLMVFDQAKGLIKQDKLWDDARNAWIERNQDKMKDTEICFIYVVTGYTQKNIVKKLYRQLEAGARGGAYGVNINGKLSTSTDQYSLDIVFGLTPGIIKRPTTKVTETRSLFDISADELKLFAHTSGSVVHK